MTGNSELSSSNVPTADLASDRRGLSEHHSARNGGHSCDIRPSVTQPRRPNVRRRRNCRGCAPASADALALPRSPTRAHVILPPMAEITSSEDFFGALRSLIDSWCERRRLKALSRILPAYLGLDGLTDGWAGLLDALRNVRPLAKDELAEAEMETVGDVLTAASKAIYRDAGGKP